MTVARPEFYGKLPPEAEIRKNQWINLSALDSRLRTLGALELSTSPFVQAFTLTMLDLKRKVRSKDIPAVAAKGKGRKNIVPKAAVFDAMAAVKLEIDTTTPQGHSDREMFKLLRKIVASEDDWSAVVPAKLREEWSKSAAAAAPQPAVRRPAPKFF